MAQVRKRIAPPLVGSDIILVIRPGQNINQVLDCTYQELVNSLSTAFAGASGFVPETRTLTINGVTYDLTQDRSWTVSGGGAVDSVNGQTGIVILALGDLSDVSDTAPAVNQILQWDGTEWVPATISTGVYTADNGLSADPGNANNFQLGSASSPGAPLLNDRYIDTGSTYTLNLKGQKTAQTDVILFIENTTSGGTGLSVKGTGLSLAIRGESTNSQGVYGISNTSVGILGQTSATSQGAILASVTSSASNLVALGLRIRHTTSAAPVAGLGVSIDLRGGTTTNIEVSFGRLMYQWTDAATATRTSKFQIETVDSATASVKLEVLGSGQLILNKYTTSTSFGSGLTSVGILNVDNTGKVFVTTAPTGTGTVSSVGTGTGLTGGTITTTGTIQLNSKLAPADSIAGNAGKFLAVNSTETAVEYVTAPTGDSVSPFLLMGG